MVVGGAAAAAFRTVATLGLVLLASTADSQPLTPLGSFSDVRSSDGEHCTGYSLALWQSGSRVFGLLDVHQGLCGDPPCGVLQDVSLDPRTGRLRFWTSIDTRRRFDGMLVGDVVTGTLGTHAVRLTRDRDRTATAFEPDQSLPAWCAFWSKIERCGGVAAFCASAGIPALRP